MKFKGMLCAALAGLVLVPTAMAANIKKDAQAYLSAYAKGDYATACSLTSSVFLKTNKISAKDCPAAMRKALGKKPGGTVVSNILLTSYKGSDGSTAYGVLSVYANGSVSCSLFAPDRGRYRYVGAEQGGCPPPTAPKPTSPATTKDQAAAA
jgi:hypothetical protein